MLFTVLGVIALIAGMGLEVYSGMMDLETQFVMALEYGIGKK